MSKEQAEELVEIFNGKNKEQRTSLIEHLVNLFPELYDETIKYEVKPENKARIIKDTVTELWDDIKTTVTEINKLWGEYENGEYEIDYYDAYDYAYNSGYNYYDEDYGYEYDLTPIERSIKEMLEIKEKISWEQRSRIFVEAIECYGKLEFPDEDIIIDFIEKLCLDDKELLFLADCYLKSDGYTETKRAIKIIKEYGKEEDYLKLRQSHLEWESNFLELINFYFDKGDDQQALEYAWKGLEKIKNIQDDKELVEIISSYYLKKEDEAQLKRLLNKTKKTKKNIVISLESLSEYYFMHDDYEKGKENLLEIFSHLLIYELKNYLLKAKEALFKADFEKFSGPFITKLSEEHPDDYCHFLFETNQRAELCYFLMEKYKPWNKDNYYVGGLSDLAFAIAEDYPTEMAFYFEQFAINLIEPGAKKNAYHRSIYYLEKLKQIDLEFLKDPIIWEKKLQEIKTRYSKRRTLIPLLNEL